MKHRLAECLARILRQPLMQLPNSQSAPLQETDALVVLGGGFRADRQLTGASRRRVQSAVRLYQQKPCRVLFSGGSTCQGFSGSEAEAMAEYAEQLGMANQDILLETRSQNTWENALFCREELQKCGSQRVMLVTCAIHGFRAFKCFEQFELQTTLFVGDPKLEMVSLRGVLREFGAIFLYGLKQPQLFRLLRN